MSALRMMFGGLLPVAMLVSVSAFAGQTPVMTFEEFPNGATNVDDFYGLDLIWLNEEVLDALATPAQPPFAGSKVLTRATCGVSACELELLSSTFAIESIALSGLISSGPDLAIRAFNSSAQQVGGDLVVDTVFQSVGCAIPTDWSCDRSFSFTHAEDVRRLQFITSGLAVIDNVQVTTFLNGNGGGAPVPEPATIALIGLGLAGLATARRIRN